MLRWGTYFQFSNNLLPFYIRSIVNEDRGETGFSVEEWQSFCTRTCERWAETTSEYRNGLKKGLRGAIGQLTSLFTKSTYIVYASKKPVTGYYKHTSLDSSKIYHEAYNDLLMVVRSVDVENTDVFNNRGIFRTLQSLLEGGYSGISLKLHGFSASCFKNFFNKSHMSVAPLPKMFEIIKKNVGIEDLMVAPNIPHDLNHFRGWYGARDISCVVSIDALIALYDDREPSQALANDENTVVRSAACIDEWCTFL